MNQERRMERTGVVFGCALICCLLWGSAFPCIKIGYGLFGIAQEDSTTQIVFAGLRFALAGALVILFGSLLQRRVLRPKRGSFPLIFRLSLAQTVFQYLFFYIGLAHTSGVKSSIIGASNVFLSIFVAVAVFHMEKLSMRKLTGCLIGFAGVVLINWNAGGLEGGLSLTGEGFLLISALSYAFSSGMIRKYSERENPVVLSGYQFFFGGGLLIVCGLAAGGRLDVRAVPAAGWMLLGYLAFLSAAAYTLWGILLKYNPVGRVSVFGFMNPVFGVLLSALLLGEGGQAFGPRGMIALLLVCAGIGVVNTEKRTPEEKTQQARPTA